MSTTTFPTRQLGENGPLVSAIGFGSMGIGAFYGKTDEKEAFDTLTYAANRGVTFWDTADIYGSSEAVLGKWFLETGRRKEIFLATKFGAQDLRPDGDRSKPRSEPSYIIGQLHKSLTALQTDYIDLYYQHRPDPDVPIEIVLETLRPFVEKGQIKWLGLSECNMDMLRRAKAVKGLGDKVIAAQMEFSPFELRIENNGFADAAKELGIAIVAYSPFARGLLTGRFRSRSDFEADDLRLLLPRFDEDNFPNNLKLVDELKAIAQKYGATATQVTIAWILAEHPDFFPLPGTRSIARFEENARGAELKLAPETVKEIRKWIDAAEVKGNRYPAQFERPNWCIPLSEWKGIPSS